MSIIIYNGKEINIAIEIMGTIKNDKNSIVIIVLKIKQSEEWTHLKLPI